jgi:hypothetical protein
MHFATLASMLLLLVQLTHCAIDTYDSDDPKEVGCLSLNKMTVHLELAIFANRHSKQRGRMLLDDFLTLCFISKLFL